MSDDRELDPHLVALGAYLRAKRLAAGLTYAQASHAGRMSVAQVQRIEGGRIDTAGTSLALLLEAYGGALADVLTILHDPAPTAERGRELAETPAEPVPAGRMAALVAELERDAGRDPELLAALGGFLAGRRSRW